jgi:fatty-acyl-CoA synthase
MGGIIQEPMELDWLKRWAQYSPKAAMVRCADSERTFTYREVFERSNALAGKLKATYGVSKGDRVAILALNEPETIFLFFALQRLGAMLVPVNFRFAPREVDHVLKDSEPKLFIYQEAFAETVAILECKPSQSLPFEGNAGLSSLVFADAPARALEVAGDFDSPVMILYTSGTTGSPKGALITNKMLFWNSVNTGLRLNITSSDAAVIFHPLFHTSGWNVLSTPFFHHGACIIMLKKFDPARVLELCEAEKATILFGVPTMMDRMARVPAFSLLKLSELRFAVVGGEPMPVDLITTWADKGIPVRQGFGLTEFGPNCFSLSEEDGIRKKGSIGFPNFYVDAKIIDSATGHELIGADQVGELCLRGPACTPGYWRNEQATKDSIREGWFHTGDLVRRDREGYFYVVGRHKEMYISGGENVYPAEVEAYLRTFKKVREVAVVGVSDSTWGEAGRCFYSSEDGNPIKETDLRAFCQTGLAKYKVPKSFVHLADLPKGDSGKILKRALTVN